MVLDQYALKGRIIPAFFSMIIPVMIFNHFYVSEEFSKFVGGVFGAKVISNMTISVVVLYFLAEAGRFIGKNGFERFFFKEELRMPTTTFLLFKDKTYSDDYKNRVRKKITADFGINLPTKEEEAADEESARIRIVETMALIRKRLKGNKFLLQHNIEYGAIRNAVGGAVIGAIFSVANITFYSLHVKVSLAVYISAICLFVYSVLIVFSRGIIGFYSKNYAKILYREYAD